MEELDSAELVMGAGVGWRRDDVGEGVGCFPVQ